MLCRSPANVRPRKRGVRIAWARWRLLGASLRHLAGLRGLRTHKDGPCTCCRTVPRACPASGDSDPVDLRHPKQFHLWLLPSGPDQVHGASPRRTRSSTPSDKGSPHDRSPRAGIQPRCSGLRVQGTASSPSSTAKGYRIREQRAGSRRRCANFDGFVRLPSPLATRDSTRARAGSGSHGAAMVVRPSGHRDACSTSAKRHSSGGLRR